MSFSFRFRLCELGGGRCKRKWHCFTGLSTFWYWPLPLAFGVYLFYEMRPHLSCKDFLLSVAKAVSNRPVRPRPNRSAGRIGKGLEDQHTPPKIDRGEVLLGFQLASLRV